MPSAALYDTTIAKNKGSTLYFIELLHQTTTRRAAHALNLCRIVAPGRRHSTTTGHNIAYLSRWSSSLISSQLRSCASLLRASYPDLRGYHFEPCPRPADEGIIGLPILAHTGRIELPNDQKERCNPCGLSD